MKLITINEKAKQFWFINKPYSRLHWIKGLHPLAYFEKWSDLKPEERRIVKQFISDLEEYREDYVNAYKGMVYPPGEQTLIKLKRKRNDKISKN